MTFELLCEPFHDTFKYFSSTSEGSFSSQRKPRFSYKTSKNRGRQIAYSVLEKRVIYILIGILDPVYSKLWKVEMPRQVCMIWLFRWVESKLFVSVHLNVVSRIEQIKQLSDFKMDDEIVLKLYLEKWFQS